jgi:ATP-dependent Zn protease
MGQGQHGFCIIDSLLWLNARSRTQDRIVMGAERRSSYIDENVKRLTAYHEGGHALTALYTEGAMPLHKVTCMPRGHALGIVGLACTLPFPAQNC